VTNHPAEEHNAQPVPTDIIVHKRHRSDTISMNAELWPCLYDCDIHLHHW
jgi:hypothetical protein